VAVKRLQVGSGVFVAGGARLFDETCPLSDVVVWSDLEQCSGVVSARHLPAKASTWADRCVTMPACGRRLRTVLFIER